MRRLVRGALVAGVVALAGCPAAHNDYPGGSCKIDSDCYEGEACMNGSICVPVAAPGDMAVTVSPGQDLAQPLVPIDAGAD
jgi:hypothetical protein